MVALCSLFFSLLGFVVVVVIRISYCASESERSFVVVVVKLVGRRDTPWRIGRSRMGSREWNGMRKEKDDYRIDDDDHNASNNKRTHSTYCCIPSSRKPV
ncbi:hypothetical protein F5H01DRAFT_334703 [Linnemannia elongata]|nr:hypothetical protein F5H01DRAFT_334703 [Linnemannia elongata]